MSDETQEPVVTSYIGMKQILSEFWRREKTANDLAYASKSSVDVLNGTVDQTGSVLHSIKNQAKNAYAGNAVVTRSVTLAAGDTWGLPNSGNVTGIVKADSSETAVADTDYTISESSESTYEEMYNAVNPITITYTIPGETIAQKLNRIDTELAAKTGFQYVKVSELPTASAETMQKIYLVPKVSPATGYVEWLTVESSGTYSWEEIGDTDIDLSGYSTTTQMQTWVTNNAKDAIYTENTTIEDAIDDVDTRLSALEAAEFGLTVNGVAATVDTTNGTHASVSVTAADIPMSSDANASSIADAIAAAGQIDDVQVSTDDGTTWSSVVDQNKVAKVDLTVKLSNSDFDDIFTEE